MLAMLLFPHSLYFVSFDSERLSSISACHSNWLKSAKLVNFMGKQGNKIISANVNVSDISLFMSNRQVFNFFA